MKQYQPLEQEELELLKEVYSKRRWSLAYGYMFFLILSLSVPLRDCFEHPDFFFDAARSVPTYLFIAIVVHLLFIIPGCILWYVRINPFRLDIRFGEKEVIPYTILRKEYFPNTGQYYVAIDDPIALHYELDEGQFQQCSEGDTIYVGRAVHSRFIFEQNGRYTL